MISKITSPAYPFNFVDRLLYRDQTISRVLKTITRNEWSLNWSVADGPQVPWWLLVELMAQVAGRFEDSLRDDGSQVILSKMQQVKWERAVLPGEQLIIEANLLKRYESQAVYHVKVVSKEEPVAEGDFYFSPGASGIGR